MKRIYLISAVGLLGLLSFCLFFFSCSKGLQNSPAPGVGSGSTLQPPNNGQCPYDCHDVRCKLYITGYCGPATPPTQDTVVIMLNLNNPEESVGSFHNTALNQVVPGLTGTESNQQLFTSIEDYAGSVGLDTGGVAQQFNNQYNSGFYFLSPDSLPEALYQAGIIDAQSNNYLSQINAAFHTYYDLNNTTVANYNNFSNRLISIENTAATDNSISSDERSMVLSAGAVGRHSMALWLNADLIATGLANPSPVEVAGGGIGAWIKKVFGKINWGKVAQTDISKAVEAGAGQIGKGNSPGVFFIMVGVGAAAGSLGALFGGANTK